MRSPNKWVKKPDTIPSKQVEEAEDLLWSMRGSYLIGRALHVLITQLDEIPKPLKEVSDLKDLRFIKDTLFNLVPDVLYEVGELLPQEKGLNADE